MRAQFVAHEVWVGLRRNLTMTIAVVATVAISLALFGTGLLINSQVNSMKDYWDGKIQVSVFLCVKSSPNPDCKGNIPVPSSQKKQIKAELENLPQVQTVYYESQKQAYTHFKEKFKNTPAFVKATEADDLPDSYRVKLTDPNQGKAVINALTSQKGVDLVNGKDQTTETFLKVLNRLKWSSLVIALLQIGAAFLLIGNTIRISAYNRRRETGIMRLVGSSNLYIHLPFLLEGAIAGLVGGLVAAGLLVSTKPLLFDRIHQYIGSTGTLSWSTVTWVIVISALIGMALCVLSSFVTLRRYLKV